MAVAEKIRENLSEPSEGRELDPDISYEPPEKENTNPEPPPEQGSSG